VQYRRFPKLGLVCDTRSHFILAARASQGPQPDFGDFEPLLREAQARAMPKAVAADAGFDSEMNHRLAREKLGIQTLIPPLHGRPGKTEPTGRYRKQMKRHLAQSRYGQRWQVETVNSMIKRLTGEVVNARSYWRRSRLLLLKTLTHNISLLARWIGFLLSKNVPFFALLSRRAIPRTLLPGRRAVLRPRRSAPISGSGFCWPSAAWECSFAAAAADLAGGAIAWGRALWEMSW
jgi:hypothetical protein